MNEDIKHLEANVNQEKGRIKEIKTEIESLDKKIRHSKILGSSS